MTTSHQDDTDDRHRAMVDACERIIRYGYGLPPRTPAEQAAYDEFADLDADAPPFAIRKQRPPEGITDADIRARAEREVAARPPRKPSPPATGEPPW
ncbi:hypothetical protein [Actinomadura montaniterrae]|uniref:Uncharacterized protein n=1 Tax=Actinomadura montaniterrae TaxID=1803903 RepID=A0A6L3VPS4_9ACTN|nr:hypothetical protein [Actinomadura montaniterrae]KAB2376962.1 hypothetical protein F9B16_24305 [Actinomadura montaniterrae]